MFVDLPPYRYAVSAFADGEAFLFSSALHHYQLLLRLAATFWGGAEFGYEQALAVAERQSAKALKLRSQPRSGRHLHRVEWHPHRFLQARTAGARCEPSAPQLVPGQWDGRCREPLAHDRFASQSRMARVHSPMAPSTRAPFAVNRGDRLLCCFIPPELRGRKTGGDVSLFSVRTDISIKDLLGAASQPLTKLRPPPAPRYAMDGDRDGLALADQNDQSFAAGDTRVEQIALQHGVVLRHE